MCNYKNVCRANLYTSVAFDATAVAYAKSIFNIFHALYFVPVEPNPPAPLSVSLNCSTSSHSIFSYLAITICAILSPGLIVNFSLERLTRITLISPL